MVRSFKVERHHARIVSKSTLFKVLNYLDSREMITPCLLVDKEKVREKVSLIGRGIQNSRVFYALKANPDMDIARFLQDEKDVGYEISSEGELNLLASVGVEAERIISSNPVKSEKFLQAAFAYGVRLFAFDSALEVEKMARLAPGAGVYVRLSVPNEGSEWPLSRKFGAELEEALGLLSLAKEKGLDPIGITFHVGSQCTNLYNWNIALDKAKILWDRSLARGIALRILNIGGGYPINYTRAVLGIETIEENIDRLIGEKFPDDIEVHIEPGRAVVGDAGVLVASVIGKARRRDENWLYIDVGVFNGLMESVGGIRYTYLVESSKGTRKNWVLGGPSCDSFDVIDKNVVLWEPDLNNLLLILSGGAYTVSYASEFNGFSIPKTVLI
ncbi:MAG: type III PLP-dependent enzyme [Thermodesulfobacteriota bacterium]